MKVGFFFVMRSESQHFLHASALVRRVAKVMPGVQVVQFTDGRSPAVPGVASVQRTESSAPLLDQRLSHYAAQDGDEWLFLDTDVWVQNDVAGVFADWMFDVAVCDRNWPGDPQSEEMLRTMPFNTGVVFTRHRPFWQHVLDTWRGYHDERRAEWMSEQRAVYDVVRTGRYRVKVLPGVLYNYPPKRPDDRPLIPALLHYKGPRKAWLSRYAYEEMARPA